MQEAGRVYEELLVLHAQAGDARALNRLVARWHPRLLRSARHFTGDDEAARDAVQESWIHIVRGLAKLRDPTCFAAWAFAILRRRCAERVRALARTRAAEAPTVDLAAPGFPGAGPDRLLLVEAFAALPEEQRVAATLYFVEQLRLDEIAGATGVPLGTVKSRIFTARQRLKLALEGVGT